MKNLSRANLKTANSTIMKSSLMQSRQHMSTTNNNLQQPVGNQVQQIQELFKVMQQQIKRQKEEMFEIAKNLKPEEECPYCKRTGVYKKDTFDFGRGEFSKRESNRSYMKEKMKEKMGVMEIQVDLKEVDFEELKSPKEVQTPKDGWTKVDSNKAPEEKMNKSVGDKDIKMDWINDQKKLKSNVLNSIKFKKKSKISNLIKASLNKTL